MSSKSFFIFSVMFVPPFDNYIISVFFKVLLILLSMLQRLPPPEGIAVIMFSSVYTAVFPAWHMIPNSTMIILAGEVMPDRAVTRPAKADAS